VIYSHRSNVLHAMIAAMSDAMGISAKDVILPVVPMFHANAWGLGQSAPMIGAKLVMPGGKMDGASIYELLDTQKVTFTAAVPTVWLMLLQYLEETGKELPHLQRLHLARSGDGLVAVAVNADEDAASAAESAKRLGLTMTIGLNDNEVYRTLGVRTLPTLFAVDKQGRLRARWDGYRPGLEREIAATVDKLLAGSDDGTTREVASVIEGQGKLEARWLRDLPGSADGVIGLPPGILGGVRVVASGGDELLSFDAAGEAIARLKVGAGSGRLYDLGVAADGTRQLAGFRPGATSVSVIALRTGDVHTIALPAPLIDFALTGDSTGDGRRITVATLRGAGQAKPTDDRVAMLDGREAVRSVAAGSNGAVLALSEDGTIGSFDRTSPAWKKRAASGAHVLAVRSEGAVIGPQTVMAAVSGRFLSGDGRQIAVATYTGHVALVDEASGRVVFDASWASVHDLGVADLDGDGLDELLVSAGRSIVALGAPKR
jgi:acyl-CoA synthetase (AMP-forming)/AMP-acid ligase II